VKNQTLNLTLLLGSFAGAFLSTPKSATGYGAPGRTRIKPTSASNRGLSTILAFIATTAARATAKPL
jgi:hypothetical protein